MNWEIIFLILFAPLIVAELAIAMIIGILLIKEIIDDRRRKK
jgi:hypothetical protein